MSLVQLFRSLTISRPNLVPQALSVVGTSNRFYKIRKDRPTPKPGPGKQYRRLVYYPEDKKYTVKPLDVKHLAGRDPVTGRKVAQGIGGGVKHKFHWVKYRREGPAKSEQDERVIDVMFDGHRSAKVALVGHGDQMKYIIATENMKAGDLIKSSKFIPRTPVLPKEGDSYPLGALPDGALVHCIQSVPNGKDFTVRAAGTFATILRRFDDYVVVRDMRKHELAYHKTCMATVGRVSNVGHKDVKLGSVQRSRELGNRPRSGLWQRKDGRFGRKIKPLPPMRIVTKKRRMMRKIRLTLDPFPEPVPIYGNAV